jgi:hypothetical protein
MKINYAPQKTTRGVFGKKSRAPAQNETAYFRNNSQLGSVFTDLRDKITGSLADSIGVRLNPPAPAPAPAPTSKTLTIAGLSIPMLAIAGVLAWKFLKK